MMKSPSHIVLCTDSADDLRDAQHQLQAAGYSVAVQHLNGDSLNSMGQASLIVLDGCRSVGPALQMCQRLRSQMADRFVPVLYLTADASPQARLASLQHGADNYILRPFEMGELLAQVETFLHIKDRHDHLVEKSAEVNRVNKRLQTAYHQIDQELELAGRIQESFLPHSLPELPGLRFSVHYRPCGRVGGDFYDVFRLDEKHVGFYVADAMGHGVPASLLTIFVKKGVRTKEISGQTYRLVPPGDVLKHLNNDLIEQALSDNPFITMAYMLFNFAEGKLQFARAGHPFPLYMPRNGKPCLWEIEGSLLGVFDTTYPVRTQQLHPGDKLLLYTDGVDAARFEHAPVGVGSLLAAAERKRDLPIQDLVDWLSRELFDENRKDDLTLFGLEMAEC